MTHELKEIIKAFEAAKIKGIRAVLATVVALEGSSYRRPGVRMLLLENGQSIGAVSGGCVEKEVLRQATSVFKTDISKVMTYDGRYRLGCEGILYLLIEPFNPNEAFLDSFRKIVQKRKSFAIDSYYLKAYGESKNFGSVLKLESEIIPIKVSFEPNKDTLVFSQELNPCAKMILIGAEHDAVQLCHFAASAGFEVCIIADPKEEKSIIDFTGATHFINTDPTSMRVTIDQQTVIVLMTHSYVKDLQFLMALKNEKPCYFGLLGPARRREKLFNELLVTDPDISETFLDSIHGPAGLDIGAETPQEIAIAVLAEILTVTNKRKPVLLKNREGRIHN